VAAASIGNVEVAALLLDRGGDINGSGGLVAPGRALYWNNQRVIDLLLERGDQPPEPFDIAAAVKQQRGNFDIAYAGRGHEGPVDFRTASTRTCAISTLFGTSTASSARHCNRVG